MVEIKFALIVMSIDILLISIAVRRISTLVRKLVEIMISVGNTTIQPNTMVYNRIQSYTKHTDTDTDTDTDTHTHTDNIKDIVPPKQSEGEWEEQPRPYDDWIICSVCGEAFNVIDNCVEKFHYCPNCGAKMKGGAE